MPSMVVVRSLAVRSTPGWREAWERIAASSPTASFFVSIGWVDCWVSVFADSLHPELLLFEVDSDVVGCCLLVSRRTWRRGIPLRSIYLNCAGEDRRDSPLIEHNALLAKPAHESEVASALVRHMAGRPWDEFVLQGMADENCVEALRSLGSIDVDRRPCPFVDLAELRRRRLSFDSALSSNTRQQIRRAQRLYEETHGPCEVDVPRTTEEALQFLGQLRDMHTRAWQDRGQGGAFESARFSEFHHRLVSVGFGRGSVELLRVRAGEEVLGVLYLFRHRGRISFYQSGFAFNADNRLKPGLLSHYLAIKRYLEEGRAHVYDFLAGDSRYKRSLCTHACPLSWVSLRRPTTANRIVQVLGTARQRVASFRERLRLRAEPSGQAVPE